MAQNFFRIDGWVKTVLGPAVPGASVFVCTQPANIFPPITPARTTPIPWTGPTPLALIYSDQGLTPVTQPLSTDQFGHYDAYMLAGLYTIVVVYNNAVQAYYIDQSIGGVGSSGGTSLLLETNGTANFNQAILNLTQGPGITLFDDNLGNTTISTAVIPRVCALSYTIDGGGSVIGVGAKGQLSIPASCTITGWVITSDQPGSAVVDVLRSSYPNFPATISLAGADKPTLASAQKNENLALTAWTIAINAGDQVQFYVDSASTVTRLNLTVNLTIP